jgi:CDP-glucose 4,6-dehydratase
MENMVRESFWKNKRVLITGNTGFKGSWLSLWLYKLNAKVFGYALKPPTKPNLFEICNLERKIISIFGDIRNLKKLRGIFNKYKPEIVFHMAAQSLVRYSYKEPVETYETNIMGTVNVFEACRYTPSVKVIVNITSDKCYENRNLTRGYRELDPMGGYDPYSSSKGCAEIITTAYLRSYFNPNNYKNRVKVLASVRAGNIIGGGDWGEDRLIPDCIKALLRKKPIVIRNPDAIRPWQFVLDPLYGYLLLAQRLYKDGSKFCGPWNFGPDNKNTKPVKWLVERIIKLWGDKASWIIDEGEHPHEENCLKLNSSKAKLKLGWYSHLDLNSALRKTVDWYKAYIKQVNMSEFTIAQIKGYGKKCL